MQPERELSVESTLLDGEDSPAFQKAMLLPFSEVKP